MNVGSGYANSFECFTVMAETAGLGALRVRVCSELQILTGTLGSDTAMLSGYTDTFTHWLREAAKRYGSSARSHRLL